MEADYTKRELDEHFKDVHNSLGEIKDDVKELNKKVGIQNGRVARLENKWAGVIMAGSAVIVLVGIIGSLIVYSFKLSQENLKTTILLEVRSMIK